MCDHCGCRAFAPIAELTADHERILELAWQVATGDPEAPERLAARDALVTLLGVHSVKEEIGLYPQLIESGDLAVEDNDRLEEEHREVHEALVADRFDKREYFALAAHIEEEESELFPFAMFAFDEDEWNRMDAAHHEAFHRLGLPHDHRHPTVAG